MTKIQNPKRKQNKHKRRISSQGPFDRGSDRPKTPAYVFFYLLFSTDAWRIAFGAAVSALATPHLAPPDLTGAGRVMLYVMVAAIGWTITGMPARWITERLKKAILGRGK